MENEKRNYYCILTQDVIFSDKLTSNEKLLYGVISSLTNEKGYCWATNRYLADLFGVTKQAISNWVSDLNKNGFISVELIYDDNGEIINRKIILSNTIK